MEKIQRKGIPIIEPAKNGYYEIYDDGRKVWHQDEFPSDYQSNRENDIEFPKDKIDLINLELDAVAQENKMKIKPPSDFIIPNQDVKNGELLTLLDEGKYNTLPQDPDREVLTFKVKTPSGDEKLISINKTSQIELIKAWGDESSDWKDKKVKVKIVNQKVFKEFKDVIYLFPAEGKINSSQPEEIPEPEEG